ncbi:MAG: hypothetical protein QXU54_01215 [Candidatus Micrarchaeia archaeon]
MRTLNAKRIQTPQESVDKIRLLSKLLIEKEYVKLDAKVNKEIQEWDEFNTPENVERGKAFTLLITMGLGGCAVTNAFGNGTLWGFLSVLTGMWWLKSVIEGFPTRPMSYNESKLDFYRMFLGIGTSGEPFRWTETQIETSLFHCKEGHDKKYPEALEVLRAMARITGSSYLMERTYSNRIYMDYVVPYEDMNGVADRP